MIWGYVNGNCKQATKTQIATIQTYDKTLKPIVDQKGSSDEWDAFFGKDVFLNRGEGHKIVVAEFHHLATNRDVLVERVVEVHKRGSFIVEARSGRSTEDRAVMPVLLANSFAFYEDGMTPEQRSEIARHAATFSSASNPRQGRMPDREAQVHLCNMSLTIKKRVALINKISREKKYRAKWSVSLAYRKKAAGDIDFPSAKPGRIPR